MKVIKFLLLVLAGLAIIWAGFWLLGLLSALFHLAIWITVFYLIGLVVWKFAFGGSREKETPQLAAAKLNEQRLAEASRKLEEIKRQQRIKQ